jgi:phosphoglycolate phosphatase
MKPLLVFDLDGTLADTAVDLVATLNAIIVEQGLRPVALADARKMVGAGARALLQRAYASQGRALDASTLETLFRAYLDHYNAHIADASELYPGVLAALDRLEASRFAFAVCTNKIEVSAKKLLDALGIADRFRAICGQDTFGMAKPDPRILTMTIARAGGSVADSVMIGDSGADVAVAKAADVPVIAVDFGYTDRPVESFGPDHVISHFDELDGAVAQVRRAAAQAVASP